MYNYEICMIIMSPIWHLYLLESEMYDTLWYLQLSVIILCWNGCLFWHYWNIFAVTMYTLMQTHKSEIKACSCTMSECTCVKPFIVIFGKILKRKYGSNSSKKQWIMDFILKYSSRIWNIIGDVYMDNSYICGCLF